MMRRSLWLSLALGLTLVGSRSASATDYWDLSLNNDNSSVTTQNVLLHGTSQQHDLEPNPGPVTDEDWYFVNNYPRSSYEAVIDSASGDLGMYSDLPNFERLDCCPSGTVLQTSEYADVGAPTIANSSLALRWQNTGTTIERQSLRARSAFCGTFCAAAAQYHIASTRPRSRCRGSTTPGAR